MVPRLFDGVLLREGHAPVLRCRTTALWTRRFVATSRQPQGVVLPKFPAHGHVGAGSPSQCWCASFPAQGARVQFGEQVYLFIYYYFFILLFVRMFSFGRWDLWFEVGRVWSG